MRTARIRADQGPRRATRSAASRRRRPRACSGSSAAAGDQHRDRRDLGDAGTAATAPAPTSARAASRVLDRDGEDHRARARRALVPGQGEAVRGQAEPRDEGRGCSRCCWRRSLAAPACAQSSRRRSSRSRRAVDPIDDGGATISGECRGCDGRAPAAGTAAPYPARCPCGYPQHGVQPCRRRLVEFFVRAPHGARHDVPRACDATARSATAPRRAPVTGADRLDAGRARHGRRAGARSTTSTIRSGTGESQTARHRRRRVLDRPTSPTPRSRPAGPPFTFGIDRRDAARSRAALDRRRRSPTAERRSRPPASRPARTRCAVFAVDVYGAPMTRRRRGPRSPSPAPSPHRRRHRRRRRATATACPTRPTTARRPPTPTRPTPTRTASATPASAPARQRAARAGARPRSCGDLRRGVRQAARAHDARVRRAARAVQDSGFIPLKGVAAVPIGSTVDTAQGRDRDRVGGQRLRRGRPAGQAPVGADQGRHVRCSSRSAKRTAKKAAIPTDIGLLLAAGRRDRAACGGPAKGTWSARSRWSSRASTARSAARARRPRRNATFDTTDRCDGTLTEVGKGRVTVGGQGPPRSRSWCEAGGAYLAKAKLFARPQGQAPAA